MSWRSGQSYSQDLRDRVLGAVDGGMAARQAAATFKVSIAYIYKALIRRRLTGDAGINPRRGHPPRKLSPEQELALAAHIRSRPGITLAQAQAWLKAEQGSSSAPARCGTRPSVWACRLKKALRAAEQDRPDVAARRKLWRAAQPFIDPDSLVFLDETGVNTKMARFYGWAPVGERCHDSAPFGHWKTNDVHRRAAPDRHERALGARRSNGWRCVPDLRPARPRSHAQARRCRRARQPARTQSRRRARGDR